MKLIISLLATASLATSAFAQEETPSTEASPEEKASATVEAASTATPEETVSPMPAAKASATPAVSPAAPKKEGAATAPAKKSAAPAVTPGKKMSVEATLKDNENKWAAAYLKHDPAAIESMLADDYVGVNSKGKIQSRRAALSEVKNDKDTYTVEKIDKMDVHKYGNNVAVVVGTVREKGTGKDGKTFDRTFRFTDTWMERNGKWQCIAAQVSLVAQK